MLRFIGNACLPLIVLALVGTSSLHAQEEAAKRRSVNNLKQLSLGLINFCDANDRFPPYPKNVKDGKPLYSWRVDLLPYIEENKLYDEFKHDEPWDSEHNKKLLDKMPKIFAPVTGKPKDKNTTHYQMIVGGGAVIDSWTKKNALKDITDGEANTILILEAEEAVPWTKPDDVVYDPKKPLPRFGGLFKAGFHAAFADGTVRFIKKDVDERLLRALITRAGGEKVDLNKLK
jgi:hypothetical protein